MDTLFFMNSLWVMLSAIFVILMIGGFILLETGSTRMKNAGHIADKTILTFGISSIVFWAVGYGLFFSSGNTLIGLTDFFYSSYNVKGINLSGSVFFLFQLAFAGIFLLVKKTPSFENNLKGSFLSQFIDSIYSFISV